MKNTKNTKNGITTTTTTTSNPGTTTDDAIMAQTMRVTSFGPFGKFFFFFVFILILNNIFSYYGYIKGTEGLREGGDEENGPKRRESRRLGNLVSFLFFRVFF